MLQTQKITAQVSGEHLVPIIIGQIEDRMNLCSDPGIVYCDIQPPMRLDRMSHHLFDVARIGHIGANVAGVAAACTDCFGMRGDFVLATRGHYDRCSA